MYQLVVWVHILMAAIWVGGLVYTAAIVVPFAVSHEAEQRQRILRGLARRFRWIGWGAVVVAVLTGLGNLAFGPAGIGIDELLSGKAFNANEVGSVVATWLPWKLALVALMIALMLFHDITSTRAAKRHRGTAGSAPGNRLGSMAASLATLVALAVLYVAVRLVRG